MARVIDISTTSPAKREFMIQEDDRRFTLTLTGFEAVFDDDDIGDTHGAQDGHWEPMRELPDAVLRDCAQLVINQLRLPSQ